MIWSPANSASYASARRATADARDHSADSHATAMNDAKCTSDCVVKGGHNSGYCDSQCRFAMPASISQVRSRAPLPRVYGPALDYQIPYANYGPLFNGYGPPDFPRAVRLMRGNLGPQTSPINVPAPLNGIGLITGQSGCQQLPNGAWRCPQQ